MADQLELPPKPDPETGQPHPPRAPSDRTGHPKFQPWHPRKVRQPPGEGRPLAWTYGEWWHQCFVFVGTAFVIALLGTVRSGGLHWVYDWVFWAIIGILSFLLSLLVYSAAKSAGADWLMVRTRYVKTYELVSITSRQYASTVRLLFDDVHGNHVLIPMKELATPPELWDLVYNGLRHSVANGAYIDALALRRLRLHEAVRIRDSRDHAE